MDCDCGCEKGNKTNYLDEYNKTIRIHKRGIFGIV